MKQELKAKKYDEKKKLPKERGFKQKLQPSRITRK